MLLLLLLAAPVFSQQKNLADLSLQDLTDVEVTMVSRKKENLFQAAAAVYVMTQEEIRQSGVTSIPEALRLVPGMQVARIDANKWAITSRGFNGRFSSKLLVLIDGRVIYNHLFSGVFWDMHDVLLEDVERIEVIRGPGATLWGSNAINGVINIITKSAQDTQGGFVQLGAGSEEKQMAAVRYGANTGDYGAWRVYLKYFERDAFLDSMGHDAADDWDALRGGFRWDWEPTSRNQISVLGDGYRGHIGHHLESVFLYPPYSSWTDYRGTNQGYDLQMSWLHYFSNASLLKILFVHDYSERDEGVLSARFRMSELDVSYLFDCGRMNQVVAGAGCRLYQDQYDNGTRMVMIPDKKNLMLWSAFIQDEIHFYGERLKLIAGSKFEQHPYAGFQMQPNIRMHYIPQKRLCFWAAVSRAVRTPSRAEKGGYYIHQIVTDDFLGDSPIVVRMQGNPDFRSETLIAWETGWRWVPAQRIFVDAAAFYNQYNHLFSGLIMGPVFNGDADPPHYVLPLPTDNKVAGHSAGIELLSEMQVSRSFKLNLNYSYTKLNMHLIEGGLDIGTVYNYEQQYPVHMGNIQSVFQINRNLELDCIVRFVDELEDLVIDRYANMDVRIGWRPAKKLQVALVGQNLLHDSILEFKPELNYTEYTLPQRGVYATLECRF
ncbi:TonB-dependent receptor [bacterium]|nr:TonB-dependent receptor [bacterium]